MLNMAHHLCDSAITLSFATDCRQIRINPNNNILDNTYNLAQKAKGGSTNLSAVFEMLIEHNIKADRIIIFSDNQAHYYPQAAWTLYQHNVVQRNSWLHLIDLAGYGVQPITGFNVSYLGGWSQKILEFILLREQNITTLIKHIEQL